jgi:hypothetical protein
MMRGRRKTYLLFGLSLASFFVMILTACATDAVAPQGNPTLSTPIQISMQTPNHPPSKPTPFLHPEPSVRPLSLPVAAKWNPYVGEWYDSGWVELDPITHEYIMVPHTPPPGYIPPKGASITVDKWIALQQNSTDEVDVALINYWQALAKDIEKQKLEDPFWMARSSIPTGSEVGGPLTILTDLGIFKLQELVDRVQWENPLVYYVETASDRISRRTMILGGSLDFQVAQWRKISFRYYATG